jgi:hypothetical protein
MKGFLFVGAITLACANEALACLSAPPMMETQVVDGRMTIQSGKNCIISYRAHGGVESQTVTKRPSHGVAETSGASIRYRSTKGYVGQDTFTITLRGRDRSNKLSTRSMRILVTVTP